jgi:AcrR family transcriptional regulator
MDDDAFDRALIGAAFAQAAELGWRHVSVPDAARAAGLPLPRARARFPGRSALLLRFGRIADQAALAEMSGDGSVRDQLFDLIMRRIDVLQAHRPGVLALLRALPCEPPTAALLACATRRSLRWLAQAAGVELSGLRGALTLRGLDAVWLWTLRAWQRDESDDLSATMAALDSALNRAEQAMRWLRGRPTPEPQSGPASAPPSQSEPSPAPESQSETAPVPEAQSETAPAPKVEPSPFEPPQEAGPVSDPPLS